MKTDHTTGGFTVIIPLIYVWYCYSICVCSLWTISKVVEPNFWGKKEVRSLSLNYRVKEAMCYYLLVINSNMTTKYKGESS